MTTTVNTPAAFGDYQVIKLLGAGMQGVTYLATDPSGRLVAVKTIPAGTLPSRKARSVLDAEVVALKATHPAYAPAFIAYEPHPDQPYYVMEHIEGPTVDEVLAKAGWFSEARTDRLAVRLTQILVMLHSEGIAHGDFRGQNLIVAADGGIYLIDYGRAVLRQNSRKLFRQRRSADLRQLAELIARAQTGRAPFGEDSSLAIERFIEGLADLGTLSGRTRTVVLALLRNRPCWRGGMSARRAHRILVRGRRARWRFWSGLV